MVVGFTMIYAIDAYLQYHCEFESRLWPGALDTTLFDEFVCDFRLVGFLRVFQLILVMLLCNDPMIITLLYIVD